MDIPEDSKLAGTARSDSGRESCPRQLETCWFQERHLCVDNRAAVSNSSAVVVFSRDHEDCKPMAFDEHGLLGC